MKQIGRLPDLAHELPVGGVDRILAGLPAPEESQGCGRDRLFFY
jgi:hypothetical protein